MEYIYSRVPDPRQLPFGVVIDEIRYLLGDPTEHSTAIQSDLEELINQQMRNKTVWVTIMHQELNQLHPSIRQALMTMAVQAFGGTSDPDAALSVAKRFHDWDPQRVRKYEPMYATAEGVTSVIDHRSSEYSIEEQEYLHSRTQLKLPKFTYLVGVAKDEGSQPIGLRPMSIARLDTGQYVDQAIVTQMRMHSMRRVGLRVGDILAEIDARRPSAPDRAQSGAVSLPVSERRVQRRSRE